MSELAKRAELSADCLDDPIPAEDLAALASIRTRKALQKSEVYRRHAETIERITHALVHLRPSSAAPRPSRRFLRLVSWNIERGKKLDGIRAFLAAES